tara:strand:+ start:466 stop:1305 length:840 start_codon:yes stop_codon:yes gene_type:complete
MSHVTVDASVDDDPRYDLLATLAGYHRDMVVGRMIKVWRWCTKNQKDVIPPEYLAVYLHLDPSKVAVIMEECGLGEVTGDGIRIKGCKDRIYWLGRLRENASKGGKARAAAAKRAGGKFVKNKPASRLAKKPAKTSRKAGVSPAKHQPSTSPNTNTNTNTNTLTKSETGGAEAPVVGYQQVVNEYFRLYEASHGHKPLFRAKEGKLLKDLLKHPGVTGEECLRRMNTMFHSPPKWLDPPYTIGTLVSNYDRLLIKKNMGSAIESDDLRQMAAELRRRGE